MQPLGYFRVTVEVERGLRVPPVEGTGVLRLNSSEFRDVSKR